MGLRPRRQYSSERLDESIKAFLLGETPQIENYRILGAVKKARPKTSTSWQSCERLQIYSPGDYYRRCVDRERHRVITLGRGRINNSCRPIKRFAHKHPVR